MTAEERDNIIATYKVQYNKNLEKIRMHQENIDRMEKYLKQYAEMIPKIMKADTDCGKAITNFGSAGLELISGDKTTIGKNQKKQLDYYRKTVKLARNSLKRALADAGNQESTIRENKQISEKYRNALRSENSRILANINAIKNAQITEA